MDLKGSLVDTNLRIYPSDSLKDFFKTIPKKEAIPKNILCVLNGESNSSTKTVGSSVKLNLQLTSEELKLIENIQRENTYNAGDNNGQPVNEKVKQDNDPKKTNESDERIEQEEENNKTDKDVEPTKDTIDEPFVTTNDLDWLYEYLQKVRPTQPDAPRFHQLIEGCNIKLPENEVLKRNPELEARCVKLRSQQEARDYRKMTKGVDNVRIRYPEDSISYQLKQMNRQLISIGQFILSIFAGFLFGFRGVEWMVGNLDFGFRLLLGVMCALVIALAEIYFLAKKLNEELNIKETVQIGGPPKFADNEPRANNDTRPTETEKAHQD